MTPLQIAEQRALGWPDIHPEDFCHRCGARNIDWFTDRESWIAATSAWAAETGREGICCVTCFADMYREATGRNPTWKVSP